MQSWSLPSLPPKCDVHKERLHRRHSISIRGELNIDFLLEWSYYTAQTKSHCYSARALTSGGLWSTKELQPCTGNAISVALLLALLPCFWPPHPSPQTSSRSPQRIPPGQRNVSSTPQAPASLQGHKRADLALQSRAINKRGALMKPNESSSIFPEQAWRSEFWGSK